MSSSKRFFTVESSDVKLPEGYDGRFEAKVPRNAGIKATRQLFRLAPKKKAIRFVLRETTQGSEKKEFHYIGMKNKLDTPRVIERGGKSITITTEYTVKACK